MFKTYILVATQPNNLGDLLINRMLIAELLKHGTVYVDSFGLPNDFRKYLFFDERIINANEKFGGTLKRYPPFSTLKKIREEGITHFFKSPGPSNTTLKMDNFALVFIYNYLTFHKIPVYFAGVDLTKENSIVFQLIKKGVKKIFLRSQQNLLRFKSESMVLDYIPDLAFLHTPNAIVKKSKKIGISFRKIDSEYDTFITSLRKFITTFIQRGYEIEFFYQVKNDFAFNKRIFDDLSDDRILFREQCLWYDDLSFYADINLVISNRLHVLLLGLLYEAIPIANIDDDPKVKKIEDIFNSIQLQDYIVRIPAPLEFTIDGMQSEPIGTLSIIVSENRERCQKAIGSIFN